MFSDVFERFSVSSVSMSYGVGSLSVKDVIFKFSAYQLVLIS